MEVHVAAIERHFINLACDGGLPFGITDNYYFIRYFASETITRDLARAVLRGLVDKGDFRYSNGLFTEDGMTAGSGYAVTQKGIDRLKLEAPND